MKTDRIAGGVEREAENEKTKMKSALSAFGEISLRGPCGTTRNETLAPLLTDHTAVRGYR
jgi:hypothetical protein